MATRALAKANMKREVPGNPGTRVRNPYVVIDSKKDKRIVEKPIVDDKRYMVTEINLYGP